MKTISPTKRKAAMAFGALLLMSAAVAAPLASGPDYTTLPVSPKVVESAATASSVKLAHAVEIAEKDSGSVAAGVRLDLEKEPKWVVDVYSATAHSEYHVDANTGAILETKDVPRFPGWAVSTEPITTDSGLMYYDVVEGAGATPAGPTSTVTVHYTGYFVNGDKFDSSVDRGSTISFPLNGVIKGWTEGVGSMKVGGKRKLIIPFDLGYGERGRSGIPPKATLIFDVELFEFKDRS